MMQRKHPSEAMTGAPGALPGEAIRILTLIVAPDDGLFLALFPRQALAKRVDHGLSERLTGPLRQSSREPIGFGVLDAERHLGS